MNLNAISGLEKLIQADTTLKEYDRTIRNYLDMLFLHKFDTLEFKHTEEALFKYIMHFPGGYIKPYATDLYLRCWEAIYKVKKNTQEG